MSEAERDLRDQFAMAAISGVCANSKYCSALKSSHEKAEWAYEVADAMMKARALPTTSKEGLREASIYERFIIRATPEEGL